MAELTNYELEDGIATISMDDGKVNALSIAMLKELHAALDRAEADEAVVVITGREGYLSAGFDLKGFSAGPEQAIEMLRLGAELMERLLSFPRPVLAVSGGHAVAAGAFMLLAADVRLGVSGEFRIGMNEVQIGLTMPTFAVELARQRLTPAAFSRSVVTARMYGPEDARVAGYLDEVVAPEELAEATRAHRRRAGRAQRPGAHRDEAARSRRVTGADARRDRGGDDRRGPDRAGGAELEGSGRRENRFRPKRCAPLPLTRPLPCHLVTYGVSNWRCSDGPALTSAARSVLGSLGQAYSVLVAKTRWGGLGWYPGRDRPQRRGWWPGQPPLTAHGKRTRRRSIRTLHAK